ncbi:Hypothetical predicted protein [Mytilus galloprovincialis]|uniref:Uncharacterized protein n=1 Tax=Mytilus galloprovincialis TaxID=29158 RepID=A0A8B6GLI1_MYTGA|nr:Hypothetical predicted protein [Mytilus galloprovincialis]
MAKEHLVSEIVGRVAAGRQGLDVTDKAKWRTKTVEEQVQKEEQTMEEENKMVKAVSTKKQGMSKAAKVKMK